MDCSARQNRFARLPMQTNDNAEMGYCRVADSDELWLE